VFRVTAKFEATEAVIHTTPDLKEAQRVARSATGKPLKIGEAVIGQVMELLIEDDAGNTFEF
jgi:hypothetical protein